MKEKLKSLTASILRQVLHHGTVRESCNELMTFFYSAVNFEESKETNKHIKTSLGLAVCPYSAAFCIIDYIRTRNYLMAVKLAVEDRLLSNPGKPVVVLYAGAGPFATLVTPLTSIFSSKQLQLVLLELNEYSIGYLKKMIKALSIEDYIIEIIQADATLHKITRNQQPDILLSETMKPGLDKEPQVSIIKNLLPQCTQNPLLIPECIIINLVLGGNRANNNDRIIFVKNLLIFDRKMALQLSNKTTDIPLFSSYIDCIVPEPPDASYTQMGLDTHIILYKQVCLTKNESSLTLSHKICDTSNFEYPAKFKVKYAIKEKPEFIFSLIPH